MALSTRALKVLRFFHSEKYGRVSRLKLDPELSEELEQILGGYIRHILERDVYTEALLKHVRRQFSGSKGVGPFERRSLWHQDV